MEKINVDVRVEPISYTLYLGSGLFGNLAKKVKEEFPHYRVAILTDSTVGPLWAPKVTEAFLAQGAKAPLVLTFPAGEASKTRAVKEELEDQLLQAGLMRDSLIIALGGGVAGDLAGFVAATYQRGVPVIQVPTTTLSMADSSIGGKTAVDTPFGKNLIGAFHHPVAVYMDMTTLVTLDERNYYGGLAEVVKHGFIQDPSIITFIEDHADAIRRRDPKTLEELFRLNCQVKNDIVREDAAEKGIRQVLNYGHTLGHAVEMAMDLTLTHGECVSIGMVFVARLSHHLGYCDEALVLWQQRILRKLGLPTAVPEGISFETLLSFMRRDKKVREGKIRFILPLKRGKVLVGIPVEEKDLKQVFDSSVIQ